VAALVTLALFPQGEGKAGGELIAPARDWLIAAWIARFFILFDGVEVRC
jgi:hypothetical protein